VTLKEFWEHIEKTRRKDPDAHVERLVARLAKLSPRKIIEFDHRWNELHRAAYNWNLWGAAYLINGGCSDDGFMDFRDWLLLQGRKVYEAALKNPDSLADVVDPDEGEYECGCYPGRHAWFRATGNEDGYDEFDAAYRAKYPETPRLPPLRGRWDHDSDKQMRRRFPRLSALYNRDGEGE
jgi:hypothetical protein